MPFHRNKIIGLLTILIFCLSIQCKTCLASSYAKITLSGDPPSESIIHFGNTRLPEIALVNWTRFWNLFNAHTAWNLEYNEGSGWFNAKTDLQVIKNYFVETPDGNIPVPKDYATQCKITLKFNASHTANYRLTFGIDLHVKNHIYKETEAKYIITYKNYTVFFDFTDLKQIKGLTFNHGVKTVNEEQWFWFRVRKDNVAQGAHLTLDPAFGYETAGEFPVSLSNSIRGSWFTCPENGIANNITVYLNPVVSGNVTCAIYKKSDDHLVGQTEEKVIPEEKDWYTFIFSQTLYISDIDYVLVAWSDKFIRIYGDSQIGKGRSHSQSYTGTFPNTWNPLTHDYLYSIYCNYTAIEEDEEEEAQVEDWYVPSEEKPPIEEITEAIKPTINKLSQYGLYIIIGVMGFLVVGGIASRISHKKVYRKPTGRLSKRPRGPKGRFKSFKPKRRRI